MALRCPLVDHIAKADIIRNGMVNFIYKNVVHTCRLQSIYKILKHLPKVLYINPFNILHVKRYDIFSRSACMQKFISE